MKQSREEKILSDILFQAWEDEAFKQRLIESPLKEIEKLTGEKVSLSQGQKLIVQDQTDSSIIYINIPPKPDMDDVELKEEELDLVSGGTTPPKLGDPNTTAVKILLGDR